VVQKTYGVGVNKYFQGAALMRECKTKIFFGGCGMNPRRYGISKRTLILPNQLYLSKEEISNEPCALSVFHAL